MNLFSRRIRLSALIVAAIALTMGDGAWSRTLRMAPPAAGSSADAAFAAALAAVAADPAIDTVVLATGVYPLDRPVTIRGARRPVAWRGAPRRTAILTGGGTTPIALIVTGRDVTVRGLTIRDFAQDGIRVGGDHNRIVDNALSGIASTGGSQAAIHGMARATNATVSRNLIEHSGYAGIEFDTNAGGDLSGLAITDNVVIDSCRTVPDCGAIYVNGRSHRNRGTVIAGNVVRDFGPAANATKGLYLDDELSGALVRGNRVSGGGTFGIEIHGGSDNRVEHNRFLQTGRFLLYQASNGAPPMRGNVIRANRVSSLDTHFSGVGAARPDLTGNILVR